MKILLGLSGSISAYKACQVLSKLAQSGHEVQTVVSTSALQSVGPATLEGLTGRAPLSDAFTSGRHMEHIHLIRWADVVVLCPASANTLSKMAHGIGDDLWTTLFLAHDFTKPYLIAPAMNATMFAHPATQSSLSKLQGWGVEILGPESGSLACGEKGAGRLLEPELIAHAIENARPVEPSKTRLKVLITSGGTREPIDAVRFIANFSTGQTGAVLADHFASRGHRVTLLHAENAVSPVRPIEKESFATFTDLEMKLKNHLQLHRYDLVIHAAAVSDYAVETIEVDGHEQIIDTEIKVPSTSEIVRLKLKKNPKLIEQIKKNNPECFLVAFKLTRTENPEDRVQAAHALSAWADVVVQNDLSQVSRAEHRAVIYKGEKEIAQTQTKRQMAQTLEQLVLTKMGEL